MNDRESRAVPLFVVLACLFLAVPLIAFINYWLRRRLSGDTRIPFTEDCKYLFQRLTSFLFKN